MININIIIWLLGGLAVVAGVLALLFTGTNHYNRRKTKVFFTVFLICFVAVLCFVVIQRNTAESGQVVEVTKTESRMMAYAENISFDEEAKIVTVMDNNGKTKIYPSEIVNVYADPRDEKVKKVNVTVKIKKVTKGTKFLGIWFVEPNAESIITLVIFD